MIYLDHAATTPIDPRVLDTMLSAYTHANGNPSSMHRPGREALQALDEARERVAAVLGAERDEIIFTSGGSESDNLAIKGVAMAKRLSGHSGHLIVSAIEHHAVLHTAESLIPWGFDLTVLPVDSTGIVSPDDLRAAIRPDTVLVSVLYANNEIGSIQPIAELGAICREHRVPFHTDAVQAAGSLPLDVNALHVDLLSLAAHKFYGPKGVGLLYVRRGTPLLPQMTGGEQERRRRAGTEDGPGIVGMATALVLAERRRCQYGAHCMALRDQLIDGIRERIPGSYLNGHRFLRLPNNANLAFDGIDGERAVLLLDQHDICVSSGSACASGVMEPSHVLLALGVVPERANGSLRLTVGKDTTRDEIERVLTILPQVIEQLRQF